MLYTLIRRDTKTEIVSILTFKKNPCENANRWRGQCLNNAWTELFSNSLKCELSYNEYSTL